jgi:hypothetical protein
MTRAAAATCTFKGWHRAIRHGGGLQNSTEENDMDFLTTLQGLDWAGIVQAAISVVGAFAVIASLTPNTSDNVISDFLLRVVNVLGANVKNAVNK